MTLHKIPTSFNGFKILQISDLHSKSFGKDNYRLINKISSENPDIIVITRDTINTKDTDFKVFINLAKQVSKSYDTYYIVGNHEQNLSGNKLKALIDNRKVSQW
ncbi:Calcineurin-like phosphoesterase [Caldanaerobius fijiensis DSM 17918]|uniref:Calcineurin-like phosphoesterase n=1 Tax=Caldanaerobius fijiensis DSM 17918 TaxID=1121256 RepID=A0A1M4Y707_9THEO|nr:Calcineurin-like phosphoesterase [Caldanaerobius fijiensis DSM 17918]